MDEVVGRATEADWEAWLKVLEDPNSQKEQEVLEGYGEGPPRCCLGHLCSISPEVERMRNGVVPEEEDDILPWERLAACAYGNVKDLEDVEDTELPKVLARKFDITPLGKFTRPYKNEEIAGLVEADLKLLPRSKYEDLTELNDNSELGLAHIATFIRHLVANKGFQLWDEQKEAEVG